MIIDWKTGSWKAKAEEAKSGERLRITIAADWAPIRMYEKILLDNPLAIYGDLLPTLQNSDLSLVNVEGVVGEVGEPIPKGGPNLRGSEETVKALSAVPFHVACLANNHTMDFGPASLAHTIAVLHNAGLKTVGAGMSWDEAAAPLYIDLKGVKVAIINCAEGEECRSVRGGPGVYGLDDAAIAAQIKEVRAKASIVLVVFHGGREHTPLPPPYVVERLRRIAAAGVSAVVAHHPHVPQGIEFIDGVPIFYSLGNFVFWQDTESFYRHTGLLVSLDFAGARLEGFRLTPYLIDSQGLMMLPEPVRTKLYQKLQYVSDLLKDPATVLAAWDAFIDHTGIDGLLSLLTRSAAAIQNGNIRGAVSIKNLFFTEAHRELYIRGMERIIRREFGSAPKWAMELVDHWLNYPYAEALAGRDGE